MSGTFPYSYVACPCAGSIDANPLAGVTSKRESAGPLNLPEPSSGSDDEEEKTFDPRAPRSRYALFPVENLLYCEDCHEIRCPRCVIDEVVCAFCPNCLFEVPSSTLKQEGNRCTRNCFQCPICTSPLSVSASNTDPESADGTVYLLACGHCNWTSADIGITFPRPNGIHHQLETMANGGKKKISKRDLQRDLETRRDRGEQHVVNKDIKDFEVAIKEYKPSAEEQFASLKKFYSSQLAEVSATNYDADGAMTYASPGSFNRIMGIYSSVVAYGHARKEKPKPVIMREALEADEGLDLVTDDNEEVERLRRSGWRETLNAEQRSQQVGEVRFLSDIRPRATLIRTKRSKRCRSCKHILVKPEAKVQSTRFRIKLVASNYVPSIKIAPLQPTLVNFQSLQPAKPILVVLTLRNPLFDPIKVTLATPPRTPGSFPSRVTILCPQFEVGQNTDVWDEALNSASTREKRRTKAEAAEGAAEPGKIWERGRNWTSVVLEIVPAVVSVAGYAGGVSSAAASSSREDNIGLDGAGGGDDEDGEIRQPIVLAEDDDVLEIPMFVHVKYEADPTTEGANAGAGGPAAEKDKKEKRELAYWTVLGVGRIAQLKS